MSEQINFQSIRQLNVLTKISQSIISTLDFNKVLQIISDGMSELMEIETAAIYLLEGKEELVLSTATPALDPNMPASLRKTELKSHPHIQLAMETCKPILLEDSEKVQLSLKEKEVVELRQLKSLIYFPFLQGENVLGVLILGTRNKSRNFTEHEIDLGQTVANQLSVAIQNTKLHADLKKHNDNLEQLVKEKTEDLDTAIEELKASNEELYEKNNIINNQNIELKATLQYLKETQSQLLQAEKMASLGTLTAGVAHEINNPLNYLMGAYHGLDQHFKNNDAYSEANVKVFLNAIKTGIERTSKIVKGLNQFSRDSGSLDENCSIHTTIDNCLIILNNQFKNNITLKKEYLEEDIIVKGNVGRLHQVFLNILNNAVYAIKNDGEIVVSTKKSDEIVTVEISDNGCGIRKKDIKKVTDPFFTTKPPGEGTGLGLSITYSIIKDHKGELAFESELGKGTKVIIKIPCKIE